MMIKVFEIISCMYLKTISPDVPFYTFKLYAEWRNEENETVLYRKWFVNDLDSVKPNISLADNLITHMYCIYPAILNRK
jgi:hypothetical protein